MGSGARYDELMYLVFLVLGSILFAVLVTIAAKRSK